MKAAPALEVYAGATARAHLRDFGLRPQDVSVVAAAAGGPKGLVLLALDRFVFGHWLAPAEHPIDLIGASIGAWRLAAACMPDPVSALARLGHDYIHERYGLQDQRLPTAEAVSRRFRATLREHFPPEAVARVLTHPRWRLHIATSRGVGLLAAPGRWRTPLGFAAAVGFNAISRRLLHAQLQRVWFTARGAAPDWLAGTSSDLPTKTVRLDAQNFEDALMASCSIPFWLLPVQGIAHAPSGPYWDGGLTDYHAHLPYNRLHRGFALIPHFQPHLVPGWLDKPWRHRHRASPMLDRAIVICPSARWQAALPGGKIPDRSDFRRFMHAPEERERLWTLSLAAGEQLAQEWGALLERGSIVARPLP